MPTTGIGVVDPSSNWFLRNEPTSGAPDAGTFPFGSGTMIPVTGDWTGSGHAGIGTFDPSTATWYLRNSASAGAPDFTPFQFGAPGWIPVTGDWAGSGHTGIGVIDPHTETWYLRNEVSAGAPDFTPFQFGAPGWIPVTGDWAGSGHTGIGAVDPATETWYLRNEVSPGAADAGAFAFGAPGWIPVTGDWAGSGHTGIGTVDPNTETWYLRNSVSPGAPDFGPFLFGLAGWTPVTGEWTAPTASIEVSPPSSSTLSATEGVGASFSISGTFTDTAGAAEQPFTALVLWGDGAADPVTVGGSANPFNYRFAGTHTYAQSGNYNVTVLVTDKDGYTGVSAPTAVSVANAAPTVGAPVIGPTATTQGVSTAFNVSGAFSDPADALDQPFTAVVHWGDDTTSSATVGGGGNPFSYAFSGSHTYATNGTFHVTVSVTDRDGGAGLSSATDVTVNAPLTITTLSLNNGTVYAPYSQTVQTSGGTGPLTFSISTGRLPPGLALDPGTGAITGTPTAATTSTFTVAAADALGSNDARQYTVAVAPPTITPSPLDPMTAGVAFSQTLTATGGLAPYAFALINNTHLPPGLTLVNGVISGTPTTVGTFSFTIATVDSTTAANGGPFSASTAYVITVKSPLVLPTTVPDARVGEAYHQSVVATGGTAPYRYSIVGGALPAFMSMSGTGVITGTPHTPGTYRFTVEVTDHSPGGPYTATQTVTLVVDPGAPAQIKFLSAPPTVVDAVLPSFTVEVQDRYGNPLDVPVTLTLVPIGPERNITTTTETLTAVNGEVTFDPLAVETSGRYFLEVTAGDAKVRSLLFVRGG